MEVLAFPTGNSQPAVGAIFQETNGVVVEEPVIGNARVYPHIELVADHLVQPGLAPVYQVFPNVAVEAITFAAAIAVVDLAALFVSNRKSRHTIGSDWIVFAVK